MRTPINPLYCCACIKAVENQYSPTFMEKVVVWSGEEHFQLITSSLLRPYTELFQFHSIFQLKVWKVVNLMAYSFISQHGCSEPNQTQSKRLKHRNLIIENILTISSRFFVRSAEDTIINHGRRANEMKFLQSKTTIYRHRTKETLFHHSERWNLAATHNFSVSAVRLDR